MNCPGAEYNTRIGDSACSDRLAQPDRDRTERKAQSDFGNAEHRTVNLNTAYFKRSSNRAELF